MILKTLKLDRALSPEQRKFIKNDGIVAELTIAKWVKLLEPLCKFDEALDAVIGPVKKWRKFFIIALILSFISSFFTPPFLSSLPTVWLILIILITLLSILSARFDYSNLNNNIREVIFPLLQMLALEGGNNKKVKLAINFNKRLAQSNITEEKTEFGVTTKHHTFEILQADCILIDNTKLSLKVVDVIRMRLIRKRKGNKIKYKLKRRIGMIMCFDKSFYSINSNKIDEDKRFKESDNKITYKEVIKQSTLGQTALIDLKGIVQKANLPYSYLINKNKQ